MLLLSICPRVLDDVCERFLHALGELPPLPLRVWREEPRDVHLLACVRLAELIVDPGELVSLMYLLSAKIDIHGDTGDDIEGQISRQADQGKRTPGCREVVQVPEKCKRLLDDLGKECH